MLHIFIYLMGVEFLENYCLDIKREKLRSKNIFLNIFFKRGIFTFKLLYLSLIKKLITKS